MDLPNSNSRLLALYRQDPCRTLPNAWWKTGKKLAELEVIVRAGPAGAVSGLAVREGERVLALWCRQPADSPLSSEALSEAPLILAHAEALPLVEGLTFDHREAYFRLIHKGEPPDYNCPPHYHYATADPHSDAEAIAELIRTCYPGNALTATDVRYWTRHPSYDPSLWVWVREEGSDRPVGLGIAELDSAVPEASLEWIQVHPDFQGQGIGSAVVMELLRRVAGRVAFTTVSGQVANLTRPEGLYRRCGFTGSDIWWLLIK